MMKKFLQLLVLCVLLPCSIVQAQIFPREFAMSDDVDNFQANPSMKTFAAIDPWLKVYALAGIVAQHEIPKSLQQDLYRYYLPQLSASDQSKVFYYAFLIGEVNKQYKLMTELFKKAVSTDPKQAKSYICGALEKIGTEYNGNYFDEEILKQNPERIKNLIPLIAQVPHLGDQNCEIDHGPYSDSGTRNSFQISVRDLISMGSADFPQQLEIQAREYSMSPLREKREVSPQIAQSFSSCNELQIRTYLNTRIMTTFSNMPKGGSQYSDFDYQGCRVHGLFKKTVSAGRASFEFYPSNGQFGYKSEGLSFSSTDDLIQQIRKATAGKR